VGAENVRAFLEHWLSRYPERHRSELVSRISKSNQSDFESSTFELIIFSILTSLGCKVDPHPDLTKSSKRADFLCIAPGGQRFYLEAVLASEFNSGQKAARKRAHVVIDALEGLDSPNFSLTVEAEGQPSTPPSSNRLRKELSRWLASLNPRCVEQAMRANVLEAAPKMDWQHDGWNITFRAYPRSKDENMQDRRVIVGRSSGGRNINVEDPIKRAIIDKGKKYGSIQECFIIFINVDSLVLNRRNEIQALFGDKEYTFQVSADS
jgi:hypothetical protein